MCPILSAEFNKSLGCHGNSGEMDLMDFVRDPMFEAVVIQLFGRENVPQKTVSVCACVHAYLRACGEWEWICECVGVSVIPCLFRSLRCVSSCTSLSSTTLTLSTEQNYLKSSSSKLYN